MRFAYGIVQRREHASRKFRPESMESISSDGISAVSNARSVDRRQKIGVREP